MHNLACSLLCLQIAGGGPPAARELPPIPAAEAKKLAAALSEGLGAGEARERAKCLALAKTLEAKFERASLLAVLARGPEHERGLPAARKVGKKKEELARFGDVTVGYAFECDGRVYRYALDVPHGYDGSKPFALLVDPGHGSGADKDDRGKADFLPFFRGQVEAAGLGDWLIARTEIVEQIGADGKLGAKPEDEVARVFAAFLRAATTRFHVDPRRIYVAGLSQTGFWSWYLGRELADRLSGIAPMSAVTWEVDATLENLSTLPTFVIHGTNDAVCKVAQTRATVERMQALKLPFKYLEIPDAGHDVATWSHLNEGLAWLAVQAPARAPRRVVRSLGTLANPWAYWLRVDELEKESSGAANAAPTARIEAHVDGQRIEVTSQGVKAVTLWLASDLVDLEQELEIVWNGNSVRARPERRFSTAIEAALERCDWTFRPEARVELH